jgi:hypothetical protein
MSSTLFDVLGNTEETPAAKQEPKTSDSSQGQLDFFSLAADQEIEQEQETGYWQSILNSVPKGAVKGLVAFGRMMGPLPDTEDFQYNPDELSSKLEEMFPTDEGFVSGAIEKGLGMAPTILGSPGGLAAGVKSVGKRVAAGAAAGSAAKKADMPEWVQSIAETVPLLAPKLSSMNKAGATESELVKFVAEKAPKKIADRLNSMVAKNTSKNEILDFARKAGMSESEITPLLQGEMKQKFLAKLSSKGEAMEGKLRSTQKSIGRVFDSIKDSESAQQVLSRKQGIRLVKSMQDKFQRMPTSVRNAVKDDFREMLKGDVTGEKVINFFQDINHELGSKTKQLSTLKDPIKKALMELDPELGRSFDMTNKLYGKYAEIAKRLKPSDHDKLFSAGKGGLALTSLLTGNFGVIKGLAALEGSRKVAEHMLTNPRMQNLSTKMISALNQNKFGVAEHIKNQLIDEVKDVDPLVSRALEELDIKSAMNAE